MTVYLVAHYRDGMTVPHSLHGSLLSAKGGVEELFALYHLGGYEALEWPPDQWAWNQIDDVDYHWWYLHPRDSQVHLWPIDDIRDLDLD